MANEDGGTCPCCNGCLEILQPGFWAGLVPIVLKDPCGVSERKAPVRLPVIDPGITEARQHKEIIFGGGVAHGVRAGSRLGVFLTAAGAGTRPISRSEDPFEDRIDVPEVMVEVEVCLEFFLGKP